jgi:drug/metabolite transporter (DMT)-like permease
MAQAISEAKKGLGSACSSARFFVGSRGQVWGDTAIMAVAILVAAFLSRALRHHWPETAAVALLVVALGMIGWVFLRQLVRGERGWMFYTAMLLFSVLPERGDDLVKAGVAPIWVTALALLAAVAAAVGIVGAVRIVQALDEMWRQVNYRALAFAFIATLTAVILQWLLTSLGVEILTWWRLLLLMVVLWGVGMIWAYRRLK